MHLALFNVNSVKVNSGTKIYKGWFIFVFQVRCVIAHCRELIDGIITANNSRSLAGSTISPTVGYMDIASVMIVIVGHALLQ